MIKLTSLLCLFLATFTGAPSLAQEKPKGADHESVRCDRPALKIAIIDTLNASSVLKERNVKIVDYQSNKTISFDLPKNSISCHATIVIANGQKFAGVLKIAAPGDKTDIDWYDDDAENGLMKVGISPTPAEEIKFIEVVNKARQAYEEAKTDLAKGAVRPQRAKAICAVLKSTQANNWVGKLVRLTTNGDGKGVVGIEIAPGIVVKTFSTILSDAASDTLIEPESKLYAALGGLSQGDWVKFSGSFFSKSTDCLNEASLTMNGSLTSPEFIMRFGNIQKAAR